jgi:pyruvate kinase
VKQVCCYIILRGETQVVSLLTYFYHLLCSSLANGPYFEAAVEVMARTCCEAEQSRNYNLLVRAGWYLCESLCSLSYPLSVRDLFIQYQSICNSIINTYGGLSVGESVASSAVKTAIDIKAKLIVVSPSEFANNGFVV